MHKLKKKNSKLLPKPIKVKKEKTEDDKDKTLYPMSHYVDDRLELVKQIFGTLKPKTITNLSPDFLKKKNMVEIEEFCLNELLCISTKRLLAIINATKCPSDTESSDDSDIQHQEEHISLEEISSDSEIEESASVTGTKKINGDSGKQKTKKNTRKLAENSIETEGQISVLELLELQARARAIRSQLALEPVTKIEVDSADEESGQVGRNDIKDKNYNSCKRKSSECDRLDKSKSAIISEKIKPANVSKSINANSTETVVQDKETILQGVKKIKLKRNYRSTNQERTFIETNVNELNKTNANAVKKEQKLRSSSPDVIPIVNEPETLLISDSEAEEISKINENIEDSKRNVGKVRKLSEEAEEGEIIESESEKNDKQCFADKDENGISLEQTEKIISMEQQNTKPKQFEVDQTSMGEYVNATDENNVNRDGAEITTKQTIENNIEQIISNNINEYQDDDYQNDDVISIGGDLESEMIEHLEDDTISKSSFAKENAKCQNEDIISLGSSGEEDVKKKTESWHARYIKSSKVSKVLAASRLGKRVRDNIKKTKHCKKEDDGQIIDAQKPKETFTSQHEDGSIEQYKELLRLRKI